MAFQSFEPRKTALMQLCDGIKQYKVFSEFKVQLIEDCVDHMIKIADQGGFKQATVDRAPLRTKYFFGEGYTYGTQMWKKGRGMERLYPRDQIEPIPTWMTELVIQPLVRCNVVPENFINSAVINDYQPGGCIVSHIDPPHIFDRPIMSLSLMSDSALSFGCRFSFKPIRVSEPVHRIALPRGILTELSGYAADSITHCVRPEDTTSRRAVILLRRVLPEAPRLPSSDLRNNIDKSYYSEQNYSKRNDKIYKKYAAKSLVTLKRKHITVSKTFFADNKRYGLQPFRLFE